MTVLQKIRKFLVVFLKYFSLVFFSFVAVIPLVSCVITAFKTDVEYQSTNVMTMPESWLYFKNFVTKRYIKFNKFTKKFSKSTQKFTKIVIKIYK